MNAISGLPKKNSAVKLTTPKATMIMARMKKMEPTTFDISFEGDSKRYTTVAVESVSWNLMTLD